MNTLFMGSTPRNLLFSCGIALLDEGERTKHLFLNAGSVNNGISQSVLADWIRSPFVSVHYSEPYGTFSSRIARHVQIRHNIRTMRRYVKDEEISRVYVFSTVVAENQAALYASKRANASAWGVYVENGGVAYNSNTVESRSHLRRFGGILAYGKWWEDVGVNGRSRWVDEVQVAMPELVRPELRSSKLTKLSPDTLLRLRDHDLPYLYLRALSMKSSDIEQLQAVLAVAYSPGVENDIVEYRHIVNELLGILSRRGIRVGVKYHPRERETDYLGLADRPGVVVLPRALPMELIFILAPRQLRFIFGDISTVLLDARWLLDNPTIVSFAPMLKLDERLIYSNFKAFGVELVDRVSDIDEILIR